MNKFGDTNYTRLLIITDKISHTNKKIFFRHYSFVFCCCCCCCCCCHMYLSIEKENGNETKTKPTSFARSE